MWENIVLPLGLDNRRVKKEEVRNVLEKIGLADKEDAMPNALSGGQKQRTAIARALVTRPAIILADEPTGNLDSANEQNIVELLQEAAHRKGYAVIVITHNSKVAEQADAVYRMQDGKLTTERG